MTASSSRTTSSSSTAISKAQIKATLSKLKVLRGPIASAKIKGIGPKTAQSLAKGLGLQSPLDLLFHFPTKVLDRTNLITDIASYAEDIGITDGDYISIALTIESFPRGRVAKAITRDDANNRVDVVYFFGVGTRGSASAHSTAFRVFGPPGSKRVVCGKIKQNMYGGRFQAFEIINPDVVTPFDDATANANGELGIEPVYKLTKGVTQKRMATAIRGAITLLCEEEDTVEEIVEEDLLPAEVLTMLQWPTFRDALVQVHTPQSIYDVGPHCAARKRLAFEELCVQQARLGLKRHLLKYPPCDVHCSSSSSSPSCWQESPLISTMITALPFELTHSQKSCLTEIYQDTNNNNKNSGRMMRLLQGDVGSGKTIVALLTALGCIEAMPQHRAVLFLAPTTLLAEQHRRTLDAMITLLYANVNSNSNNNNDSNNTTRRVYVDLLTGAIRGKQRNALLQTLEECPPGEAYIVVGTHALLTDTVAHRIATTCGIALAIIDEEQRFGVHQREVLANLAQHTLYMSATPIPRTIALGGSVTNSNNSNSNSVVVGTLDVSTLQQRPKGAREVHTSVVSSDVIPDVMLGVQRQIALGAKAFWILPIIGDDDDTDTSDTDVHVSNVISRHAALSNLLGPHRVSYVHGRMDAANREESLHQFADLKSGVDVMVGTTVLEVGIDIPWATLLVVEGAERFGLSQLHQLRGRIGRALPSSSSSDVSDRSKLECHCAIISDIVTTNTSPTSRSPAAQRLRVLQDFNDGEEIAIEDFRIRGPGDVLGTLQSGGSDDVCSCVDLMAHYGMIVAASRYGRSFLPGMDMMENHDDHYRTEEESISSSTKKKNVDVGFGCTGEGRLIEQYLDEESSIPPLYTDGMSASTVGGLLLRTGMLLFAQKNNSLDGMTDVEAFEALGRLTLQQRQRQHNSQKVSLNGDHLTGPTPTTADDEKGDACDQLFIDFAKKMDPQYRMPN